MSLRSFELPSRQIAEHARSERTRSLPAPAGGSATRRRGSLLQGNIKGPEDFSENRRVPQGIDRAETGPPFDSGINQICHRKQDRRQHRQT